MESEDDLEPIGSTARTAVEVVFVVGVLLLLVAAVSTAWLLDDDDDVEQVEAVADTTTTITVDGLGAVEPTSVPPPQVTAPPTTAAPTTVAPATSTSTSTSTSTTTTTNPPITLPPTTLPPTTPATLPPTTLPPTTLAPTTRPPASPTPAAGDGSIVGCRGAPGGTSATVRVLHRSGPAAAFRVSAEYYDESGVLNGSASARSRVISPQGSGDVTVFIPSNAPAGSCRIAGTPVPT